MPDPDHAPKPGVPTRTRTAAEVARAAEIEAECERLGIRSSVRITTTKPTEAELIAHQMRALQTGEVQGLHMVHAPFYQRRVRTDEDNPKVEGFVSDPPQDGGAEGSTP